jgi:hypothetical protein
MFGQLLSNKNKNDIVLNSNLGVPNLISKQGLRPKVCKEFWWTLGESAAERGRPPATASLLTRSGKKRTRCTAGPHEQRSTCRVRPVAYGPLERFCKLWTLPFWWASFDLESVASLKTSLICYEIKILFRLKNTLKSMNYKTSEHGLTPQLNRKVHLVFVWGDSHRSSKQNIL